MRLRISFKPLKANNEDKQPIPTKYRIYRLDVDSSVKKLNSDMKPDILSKKGPENRIPILKRGSAGGPRISGIHSLAKRLSAAENGQR